MTPLVSVRELAVRYRTKGQTVAALDGIDLDWQRGEILGLVGESGCGKTTLGRAIVGLETASGGDVTVDGRDGNALGRRERARLVQMVFQDPYQSLDPRQTIGAQVMEGLDVHRIGAGRDERLRRAVKALHDAGLSPADRVWSRYPHELSGGQRQRVVIAGALALEPDGLVCDEPVAALDASVRTQVLALLAELRAARGVSLLFITHDVGIAWTLCDRVAVMYLGRIVELGSTEDVLLAPRHPYTRALLDAVPLPVPSQRLRAPLRGTVPDARAIPSGCRFRPRCSLAVERCANVDPQLAGAPQLAACVVANDDDARG